LLILSNWNKLINKMNKYSNTKNKFREKSFDIMLQTTEWLFFSVHLLMNNIDQQYTPPYLSLNSSNDFHVNERAMTLIHGQWYITYVKFFSRLLFLWHVLRIVEIRVVWRRGSWVGSFSYVKKDTESKCRMKYSLNIRKETCFFVFLWFNY
jgi:hypothetical protein